MLVFGGLAPLADFEFKSHRPDHLWIGRLQRASTQLPSPSGPLANAESSGFPSP
jgi:hypothetical protein